MRRAKPEKREITPDLRYNNLHLQTLIHHVMKRGKKSLATRLVYETLDILHERTSRYPVPFKGNCPCISFDVQPLVCCILDMVVRIMFKT